MEKVYNLNSIAQSAYKIFPWEGDINKAIELMGPESGISLHASREDYLKSHQQWAVKFASDRLDREGIKEGTPFAIIRAYHEYFVALSEGFYFVYGMFGQYDGGYDDAWRVLTTEEMTRFVSADRACEFINKKEHAKS